MKIKTALKVGVAISALFSATSVSSSVSAASLEEALMAAYDNNPTLLGQRASLRATDESVPQALSGWRPVVTGTGTLGLLSNETDSGTTTSSDRDYFSAAITATQNLYAGGETEKNVEAAEASVYAARARLEVSEQTILFEAATAYLDVLRDVAVLDLNQQNEARLKRQLEATQDRFDVGEVTRTDVAQAESRLSRARAETISAAGTLETSKAAYVQVVGEEISGSVSAPILNLGLPESRDAAISTSVARNPSVKARRYDYDAAKLAIDVKFASTKPSLDLVGSTSYKNDVSAENYSSREASIKLSLNVPIYQGGVVSSQVREAKELASVAQIQIEQEKRDVIEVATSSWENLKATRAQIEAQQDEVRATTIAFEGVEQEASVGSRTVLDVLDAEQELLDAKVNLVKTKRNEIVAQFALLSSVGGLTMRQLGLSDKLYDETGHFDEVRDVWYGYGGNEGRDLNGN